MYLNVLIWKSNSQDWLYFECNKRNWQLLHGDVPVLHCQTLWCGGVSSSQTLGQDIQVYFKGQVKDILETDYFMSKQIRWLSCIDRKMHENREWTL